MEEKEYKLPYTAEEIENKLKKIDNLATVEVSETEPTNENTDIWINPTNEEEYHFYTAEEIDEMLRGLNTGGGNAKDGREVELQNNGTHIQWRYIGESSWKNLVALSVLKGDKGDNGRGFTFLGEWDETAVYFTGDVVTYDGALYVYNSEVMTYGNTIDNYPPGSEEAFMWYLMIPSAYTPQKGTDYFTEADKQELVTNVLNALPTWTGGNY